MLCEHCQQRPASVHFTRIVNGTKKEEYLCEQCAREKEFWELSIEPEFSIHQLLGAMLGTMGPGTRSESAIVPCPQCGLTFAEFKKTGMLGCSQCYRTFSRQLEPILRRIHGSTQHKGKLPARKGKSLRQQRRIEELKEQLAEAVRNEQFEEAARLRDQIRALQNSQGGVGRVP